MFDDINEILDVFKGSLPYYFLVFVPILVILSPVHGSHEFPVYRMQHFDLHGVPHGCRSAGINLEARSLYSWSTSRHCVVARLQDLTIDRFRAICMRAGALTIVLPRDLNHVPSDITKLESEMLSRESSIPIYITYWSPQLESIIDELETEGGVQNENQKQLAGWQAMFHAVAANGYQMVVSGGSTQLRTDTQIANIHGRLLGHGPEETLNNLFIVAHYDAFGLAPDLAHGADSNGSGVAILLEIARIFSILYSNPRTHAKFNIYFLISGAGKFNYLGSKKYLEDQIDQMDLSNRQSGSFVVCLDSLARNSSLHVHVSKPPKDGSLGAKFLQLAQKLEVSVKMVHKKINLADEMLAWEHERFSIRKLQAFTISALSSHKELFRSTIFDRKENIDPQALTRNAATLIEALAELVYGIEDTQILTGELKVEQSALESTLGFLSGQPRSQQLISEKSPLITSMHDLLAKYVKEVGVSSLIPNRRDPDVAFFDNTHATLNVYSVKPAVFDLFLTVAIITYLGIVYFILNNFSTIYHLSIRLVSAKKKIY